MWKILELLQLMIEMYSLKCVIRGWRKQEAHEATNPL